MKPHAARLAVAAGLFGAAAALAASAAPSHDLVLTHVTVVDTRDGSLRPDTTVVIDAGRIVSVAPARGKPVAARRTVDARGKFLVPGYLDMHVHVTASPDIEGKLDMLLAYGVTGFRQMAANPEVLAAQREGKLMPKDSPRLLASAGNILVRPVAPTPAAAVAEVDRQHDQGADFIKVIDLSPESFAAVAAETKRLGMTFAGHLPGGVDAREASRLGMRSIEHLGTGLSFFMACSGAEDAVRAQLKAAPPPPPTGGPGPPTAGGALDFPVVATNPVDFDRYRQLIDGFSPEKCDALARTFIANQTWQSPTLIRLRTMDLATDPAYRNDLDLQYVPVATRKGWNDSADAFAAKLGTRKADLERIFKAQSDMTGRFARDGVPMLAGSDLGGGWVIPGVSLHQEFDLLGQAGLTPLQVLQATTRNGADFLHMTDRLGSVTAGKDADLVLLDANPISSVANLHRIDAVVLAGRYHSRDDLDALKRRVAARDLLAAGDVPNVFSEWQKFRADRWGDLHVVKPGAAPGVVDAAAIAEIKAKTAAMIAAYKPAAGDAIDLPPVIWRTSEKPMILFDDPGAQRMIVIPAGEFTMGSPANEPGRRADEGPRRRVRIEHAFAVSLFPIVYGEYAWFISETGHRSAGACATLDDGVFKARSGRDWDHNGYSQTLRGPATCMDFNDATAYAAWVSKKTGHHYRLLSEAEYEYASRAGSGTAYPWGTDAAGACAYANGYDLDAPAIKGSGAPIACHDASPVVSELNKYKTNGFGLSDMAGNVAEWTQDCWSPSYRGAPADGSANLHGNCAMRVLRGGSFASGDLRAASRDHAPVGQASVQHGFRVVREL
jgi:formylglycine-generating enzyme required for sulfatase activity/imidazolonepropionase-like amidohydrolase